MVENTGRNQGTNNDTYQFGIESVPLDDDFAYWVSLKRAEHEGKLFSKRIKTGLMDMMKAECSDRTG